MKKQEIKKMNLIECLESKFIAENGKQYGYYEDGIAVHYQLSEIRKIQKQFGGEIIIDQTTKNYNYEMGCRVSDNPIYMLKVK